MRKKTSGAPRFPLLVYRRLFDMWFWPSLLLALSSGLLLWKRPEMLGGWVWLFVPVVLVAVALAVFSLLARYGSTVHPHANNLRVSTPFFRLIISYGRVNIVRTTQFKAEFPPEELSWTLRRQAGALYGQTCIVVEMKGFPLPKRVLRFMLNDLMLSTRTEGLVFLVKDWLALSNAIEGARAEWVARRLMKREQRTVERVLRDK